jgi:hypothetical protein
MMIPVKNKHGKKVRLRYLALPLFLSALALTAWNFHISPDPWIVIAPLCGTILYLGYTTFIRMTGFPETDLYHNGDAPVVLLIIILSATLFSGIPLLWLITAMIVHWGYGTLIGRIPPRNRGMIPFLSITGYLVLAFLLLYLFQFDLVNNPVSALLNSRSGFPGRYPLLTLSLVFLVFIPLFRRPFTLAGYGSAYLSRGGYPLRTVTLFIYLLRAFLASAAILCNGLRGGFAWYLLTNWRSPGSWFLAASGALFHSQLMLLLTRFIPGFYITAVSLLLSFGIFAIYLHFRRYPHDRL